MSHEWTIHIGKMPKTALIKKLMLWYGMSKGEAIKEIDAYDFNGAYRKKSSPPIITEPETKKLLKKWRRRYHVYFGKIIISERRNLSVMTYWIPLNEAEAELQRLKDRISKLK